MTDRTEERLEQGLRSRADGLTEAPLTLADVKATARTIRRRRRSAGAGVAAVVLAAVAVPVGLGLSGSDDRVVQPAPAPSPAEPVPGYVQDSTVHLLDGTEVPLGGISEIQAWAPLGEGYVAAGMRQGRPVVSFHDEGGSLETTWPVAEAGSFVVDADGRYAAWSMPSSEVLLLDGTTGEVERLRRVAAGTPVARGIVGDCAEACGVVVTDADVALGSDATYLVSTDGDGSWGVDVPLVVAVSADDTLVAGITGMADDDIHVCSGVWRVGRTTPLWEDCIDNVHRFSPDGRHVAATFVEGLGPRELRLRDATSGAVVHEMPIADAVDGVVWADAGHVLAAVLRSGRWSVVRIGIDGQEEVLAGPLAPLAGDIAEVSSPYLLPTGP